MFTGTLVRASVTVPFAVCLRKLCHQGAVSSCGVLSYTSVTVPLAVCLLKLGHVGAVRSCGVLTYTSVTVPFAVCLRKLVHVRKLGPVVFRMLFAFAVRHPHVQ